MNQIIEIALKPDDLEKEESLIHSIRLKIGTNDTEKIYYQILKRSLDARKTPLYRFRLLVSDSPLLDSDSFKSKFKDVSGAPKVIIVGAGPAGYYAALECLELGLKPIIFDRGKNVRDRRRDLRAIQQFSQVNPNSNYCFGEGGAGTYSDGKLYTRSGKRGDIYKVSKLFVEHGATPEILYDAHPHIGSNKLPDIIQAMRESIESHGGEIHFDRQVTDFILENGKIRGVRTSTGIECLAEAVVLATGHSARDIYYLLHSKGLLIEPKSLAIGVRIEHPQALIDSIQYHNKTRHEQLPPAAYSLTCTINDRGIFSFCMCPGGLMVPAATAPGEIVINGMSLSRRDSKFANSGTVVAIHPADFTQPTDPFCCLDFQREVEQKVFAAGDGSQKAPAQRLTDFMQNRLSGSIGDTSYIPGVWSAPIHEIMPQIIVKSLKLGIQDFSKKMKGYLTEEAIVVATESRTSSPVRIPRNSLSMHPQCEGLFPCGEGAGYAGGIVSAAMDGQHVAKAVYQYIMTN